jgi:septal ring factor EnvC (AmiA/AmiB activator)
MSPGSPQRVFPRLLGAVVSAIALTASVQSATQEQAADLIREAEQRIRELQTEADRLAAQASTLLADLRKLELERAIRTQALRKADAALTQVSTALAESSARVQALEAQRLAATAGVRERLVEIYKRGRSGYVRLLLASEDLQALGRLSRAVAAVARLDRMRFDEHRRILRAEQAALAELDARKPALAVAHDEARRARAALDAAVAAHNGRIDDVDRRRDLAAQYMGELQTATTELERRIGGLSSADPGGLPLKPFKGALDWPATGAIASPFGRGTGRAGNPIDRHGIEIASADGRDVRAVHGGTVSFAGPFLGYGTLVILDHGGNDFTVYGHLQQTLVEQGARAERGSVLGRAGRNPDGAEVVYFEVRVDGRPVDPVQWLKARPSTKLGAS